MKCRDFLAVDLAATCAIGGSVTPTPSVAQITPGTSQTPHPTASFNETVVHDASDDAGTFVRRLGQTAGVTYDRGWVRLSISGFDDYDSAVPGIDNPNGSPTNFTQVSRAPDLQRRIGLWRQNRADLPDLDRPQGICRHPNVEGVPLPYQHSDAGDQTMKFPGQIPPKFAVLLAVPIVILATSMNSRGAQAAVVCKTLVGQASGSNQVDVQRGARRKYDAMRKAENIRAGFRPVGRPFTRCRRSSGRYTCFYSRKVCSGT